MPEPGNLSDLTMDEIPSEGDRQTQDHGHIDTGGLRRRSTLVKRGSSIIPCSVITYIRRPARRRSWGDFINSPITEIVFMGMWFEGKRGKSRLMRKAPPARPAQNRSRSQPSGSRSRFVEKRKTDKGCCVPDAKTLSIYRQGSRVVFSCVTSPTMA